VDSFINHVLHQAKLYNVDYLLMQKYLDDEFASQVFVVYKQKTSFIHSLIITVCLVLQPQQLAPVWGGAASHTPRQTDWCLHRQYAAILL